MLDEYGGRLGHLIATLRRADEVAGPLRMAYRAHWRGSTACGSAAASWLRSASMCWGVSARLAGDAVALEVERT